MGSELMLRFALSASNYSVKKIDCARLFQNISNCTHFFEDDIDVSEFLVVGEEVEDVGGGGGVDADESVDTREEHVGGGGHVEQVAGWIHQGGHTPPVHQQQQTQHR